MKKKLVVFTSLMLFILISASPAFSEGIDFSLRYYDKKIYFPESEILIKAEIINNSPNPYRFKLADHRVFNLDFTVRTLQNRQLTHSENYIIQRNPDQPVFFREITLAPGEQYSFIEDLTDYVEGLEPGVYVVQATFYPELAKGMKPVSLTSNYLDLSVRPSAGLPALEAMIDEETGRILQKNPIPPDEVVSYMINARQKSQWEKFFLYLDVESIMLRNPEMEQSYRRSSDTERRSMLENYKRSLSSETADDVILLIPDEYEIIKTEYTARNGKVTALLKFRYPGYTEIKEYTYYLNRKDRVWYIYNYIVRNIGTE